MLAVRPDLLAASQQRKSDVNSRCSYVINPPLRSCLAFLPCQDFVLCHAFLAGTSDRQVLKECLSGASGSFYDSTRWDRTRAGPRQRRCWRLMKGTRRCPEMTASACSACTWASKRCVISWLPVFCMADGTLLACCSSVGVKPHRTQAEEAGRATACHEMRALQR